MKKIIWSDISETTPIHILTLTFSTSWLIWSIRAVINSVAEQLRMNAESVALTSEVSTSVLWILNSSYLPKIIITSVIKLDSITIERLMCTHHKLKAIWVGSPVVSDVFQCDMICVCEQNAHRLLCVSTWDVSLTIKDNIEMRIQRKSLRWKRTNSVGKQTNKERHWVLIKASKCKIKIENEFVSFVSLQKF